MKTESTAVERGLRLNDSLPISHAQKLSLSNGPGGIFTETQTLKESHGKVDLVSMIRNKKLLEKDGMEDLYFYEVHLQQHQKQILSKKPR